MSKAAQGFTPRRTLSTSQAENPRRTRLIGKRAISGQKLTESFDYERHAVATSDASTHQSELCVAIPHGVE